MPTSRAWYVIPAPVAFVVLTLDFGSFDCGWRRVVENLALCIKILGALEYDIKWIALTSLCL